MASKRKQRRRSCTSKYRHETAEAAWSEARRLTRRSGGRRYNAYKCEFCGGYHVGRPGRGINGRRSKFHFWETFR